jgi:hypothetical protein
MRTYTQVTASLRAQIKADKQRYESIIHALESRVAQLEAERDVSIYIYIYIYIYICMSVRTYVPLHDLQS